ncbi:MAG: transketolase family protein [Coprothermobacterota bacterium]|nr:transketolase family protein [Coprothermobacterota bacterium]
MTAIRDAFGKALVELGGKNDQVVVLDADLGSSTRADLFAKTFPERFFQMGIAEQNMMGVAAGLALSGKIPFVTSFATFVTKRACDQVAISIAYPNLNVKIIGAYTGLFSGHTGATHQAIEDISIMRGIPNIVIIDPADAEEMRQAVPVIADYRGPVYLRETRDEWPDIFGADYQFAIGKSTTIIEGQDASIIACGVMTSESIRAAAMLAKQGIKAQVINMSTIKPIDRQAIVTAAQQTGIIITAENHSIFGGLGSAVAEVLVEELPCWMRRVGIPDVFGESGSNQELMEKYGLSAKHIAEVVMHTIKKGR